MIGGVPPPGAPSAPAVASGSQLGSSVEDFYGQVPRLSGSVSHQQKRRELSTRGATYWVVRELSRLFPDRRIESALELGGEYAATLNILTQEFSVGKALSCDLVLPAERSEAITYLREPIEGLAAKLRPRTFDVVLLVDVIEHLYDPDAALDEIKGLLKPQGVLVMVTPNLASWLNRCMLLAGFLPFYMEVSTRGVLGHPGFGQHPVGHIRLFTVGAMREFLHFSGFEVVALRSAASELMLDEVPDAAPPAGDRRGPSGKPARAREIPSILPVFRRVDRLISRAAPTLGSRIIVVAKPSPPAQNRPRPPKGAGPG